MNTAEIVHNQTPYAEMPEPALVEEHGGREAPDPNGVMMIEFPDGSALREDPVFGCTVVYPDIW